MPVKNTKIALIVNEKHGIHTAPDDFYPEKPERIDRILKELDTTDLFKKYPAEQFDDEWITAVHSKPYVSYIKEMAALLNPGEIAYPRVFPIRNLDRLPEETRVRAGYYAIDKFTPLTCNAYPAARAAADCALTAAEKVLQGDGLAYALVRPPGHHAESDHYGGFCYLNSTAIAANYLSKKSRVAILDVDYHNGNGTQQIFYDRSDVLTVSIHGDPTFNYPCYSGFKDEIGSGAGKGYNLNIPLPRKVDGAQYKIALQTALKEIEKYEPGFLVIALGFDISEGDTIGTWSLTPDDFEKIGKMIGSLELPMVVVQEGGYGNQPIGINARNFFRGLVKDTE